MLCSVRCDGALVNGRVMGGMVLMFGSVNTICIYSCRSTAAAAVDDGVERSVVIYHSP